MATIGFLWRIDWYNPYTSPPEGMPRVLAEMFSPCSRPGESAKRPREIEDFAKPTHYKVSVSAIQEPIKQLGPGKLASMRQKRLASRIKKKYPMFEHQFINQAIVAKPDYYLEGKSDMDAERNRLLTEEARKTAYWIENANRLFRYDQDG